MKRMRLEGRALLNVAVFDVDSKIRWTGVLVLALWALFYRIGGEWVDQWLLTWVGVWIFGGAGTMFIATANGRWTWRAVGLFWILVALTCIALPAGIVRVYGEVQSPRLTRSLWRAAAVVGSPLFAWGLYRYHQTGGQGDPMVTKRSGYAGLERRDRQRPGRRKEDYERARMGE